MNLDSLKILYKLSDKQINNINIVINEAIKQNIIDIRQVAYILATIKHETANTFEPIKEYGGLQYFIKRYWTNSKVAKILGNDDATDAGKYFGRGYCQLTGENNYELFTRLLGIDLKNNPDLALNPDVAAKIIILGMKKGLFTGVNLDRYFTGALADTYNARKIINRLDKTELIQFYYTQILKAIN